ncbi:MAG TPA: hypothetical protein VFH56_02545 [Acidimicrobiales bacterium]|nr:hypothetical protein [Acidimicrobiales bacterium]
MTTSVDTKLAWETVADRLEALGLKLKFHFEEAEAANHPAKEVSEAFARLGTAIESTFYSVGAAVKDPAVRDDATNLATALGDALADTLSEAAQELTGAANGLRCKGDKAKTGATNGAQ